jgi:DNA-binding GntR family transcriptional regulator
MSMDSAAMGPVKEETPGMDVMPDPRPSRVHSAYAALKRAILENELAPGETESTNELALRLGMSRTPIHEAALRLQEEGLVQILPKRGIRIASLSPGDVREIFEVIISIEGDAARLAACLPAALRDDLAARLDRQTDRMAGALAAKDLTERGHADADFHRLLVEGSRNQRFERIIRTLADQSHRARALTAGLRPPLEASIPEHRAIANSIRKGEPESALAAARAHRIRALDEIVPLIETMGLRHL